MFAHSDRFVFPSTTMPACRSRSTSTASRLGAGTSVSASDPAVVGRSAVSTLSLTSTTWPCRALRWRPSDASRSSAAACFPASGFSVQTAFV